MPSKSPRTPRSNDVLSHVLTDNSAIHTRCSYRLLQGINHPLIPRGLKPDFGEIEGTENNITSLTGASRGERVRDDYWVMDAAIVAATPGECGYVRGTHDRDAYNEHAPPNQNG